MLLRRSLSIRVAYLFSSVPDFFILSLASFLRMTPSLEPNPTFRPPSSGIKKKVGTTHKYTQVRLNWSCNCGIFPVQLRQDTCRASKFEPTPMSAGCHCKIVVARTSPSQRRPACNSKIYFLTALQDRFMSFRSPQF